MTNCKVQVNVRIMWHYLLLALTLLYSCYKTHKKSKDSFMQENQILLQYPQFFLYLFYLAIILIKSTIKIKYYKFVFNLQSIFYHEKSRTWSIYKKYNL